MKTKKNYSRITETKESKAIALFAEMMIEKIKTIQTDWKKPWFTETKLAWPRNISGREYNGMNSFMLLMHCERQNYNLPVFLTFNRCTSLNYNETPQGRVPAVDTEGNKLPFVHVLKGEKSFPVFLSTFTVKDNDGNKIKYDDYKLLSEEEKKKYTVYPGTTVYDVFNIDQTNIREARPELYKKIKSELLPAKMNEAVSDAFEFRPFDVMAAEDKWICPIRMKHQDSAYYSITQDEIVLPEKSQFADGQSFYSTAFHECIHSTGHADRLNRLKPGVEFGSKEYAREELVAELGAALVANRYGFGSHIKEESAAYLKSWLKNLKEEPAFIKTTLYDVKRATSQLIQCLEALGAVVPEKEVKALPMNYHALKSKYPDAVLLFRTGDFYTTFESDAEEISNILDITLTEREGLCVTAFPYHAIDVYLPKLIRAGKRVAICDDIEEAA